MFRSNYSRTVDAPKHSIFSMHAFICSVMCQKEPSITRWFVHNHQIRKGGPFSSALVFYANIWPRCINAHGVFHRANEQQQELASLYALVSPVSAPKFHSLTSRLIVFSGRCKRLVSSMFAQLLGHTRVHVCACHSQSALQLQINCK